MTDAPVCLAAFAMGIVLMVGCGVIERAPQPSAAAATPTEALVLIEPRSAPAATPPAATASLPAQGSSVAAAPVVRPAEPARTATAGRNLAKPAASTPPAPVKVAQSPAPAAPAVKAPPPPPVMTPAAMPPQLDLKALETQLKATKAIGVFTKLSLKNQIDDLLGRFRAFHQGGVKSSLAELRRSYDMLVMKTLALLQDGEPSLAGALASSRESIWGILSDPAKFATV